MSADAVDLAGTGLAVDLSGIGAGADVVRRRRRFDVLLWVSVVWLAAMLFVALFADLLPLAPYDQSIGAPRQPPFQHLGDSLFLGTDGFGRSILSRALYGARTSLLVGLSAAAMGCILGGLIGLIAGYLRGHADRVVSFVIDTLLAFPPLVVLLTLAAVFRPQLSTVIVGLTVLSIPTFARLERASALSWAERPFVVAARSYGSSRLRTAFRHVLPNSSITLVTFFPSVIAGLIVAEGSLSFLGLGVPSPTATWGGMIYEGKSSMRNAPFLVFIPATFVFLTVSSFNTVGERIRGRLDSRAHG